MVVASVPKDVRLVTDRIKSLYDKRLSYRFYCFMISYFLLSQRSVSKFSLSASYSVSPSWFGRQIKRCPPNRLLRRIRKSLLKKIKETDDAARFVFAIDDTANPKYGKNMTGVALWGSSGGVYKGQKIFAVVVVDLKTKKAYPVAYRIQEKESDETGIDIAANLISDLVGSGFPPLVVVADSWFCSTKLMSSLTDLGCEFVCQTKSNRKVKANPSPNVLWTTLIEVFKGSQRQRVCTDWDNPKILSRKRKRKIISERVLKIRCYKSPVKIIAAYNRRGAKKPFAYYISTSRTRSGAMIWLLARARWKIECVFRTCKQNFSFGKLSCSGREASHLAVEMPFFLYCLLSLEPEKFCFTDSESVDAMARKIRQRITDQTIELLIERPDSAAVIELRQKRSLERSRSLGGEVAANS